MLDECGLDLVVHFFKEEEVAGTQWLQSKVVTTLNLQHQERQSDYISQSFSPSLNLTRQ